MSSSCKKIVYPSYGAAAWAVRHIPAKRTGLAPVRPYACGKHKGRAWHITSNPKPKARRK